MKRGTIEKSSRLLWKDCQIGIISPLGTPRALFRPPRGQKNTEQLRNNQNNSENHIKNRKSQNKPEQPRQIQKKQQENKQYKTRTKQEQNKNKQETTDKPYLAVLPSNQYMIVESSARVDFTRQLGARPPYL